MTSVVTFLRNYDYAISLVKGSSWTLDEAVDYLAAYQANKIQWSVRDDAYIGFLNIKERLSSEVELGVSHGKLLVNEVYDENAAGGTVTTAHSLNLKKSTVIKYVFIEWAMKNSIDIPLVYKEYVHNYGAKKPYYEDLGIKKSTIYHERCRAVAELLWSIYPDITIAEMAGRSEIIQFGCEGNPYHPRTISRWLANLKVDGKPGRPKKVKSS